MEVAGFTTIYASPNPRTRAELWDLLSHQYNEQNLPLFIHRDINEMNGAYKAPGQMVIKQS